MAKTEIEIFDGIPAGLLSAFQDPEAGQHKALQAAVDLVSGPASLKDLWEKLTEDWENLTKLFATIDPKAKTLEGNEHWLKAQEALESYLDEKGHKLLIQYNDDHYQRDYYRMIASFYLGYAAATSLNARVKGRA